MIDFKRKIVDMPAIVQRLEYDPNRSALIALVKYEDSTMSYILAPEGLKIGDQIMSTNKADSIDIKPGNTLRLKNIPVGTLIHNIELRPGSGGQMVRSAGTYASLLSKEDERYALVRLVSGEQRKVLLNCRATVGTLSNPEWKNQKLGKAGRSRWLGRRPAVRGVAMNPVDHPHGGGEGKTSGGRHSCSPWGILTKGFRTRKKTKLSNKFIVRKRPELIQK